MVGVLWRSHIDDLTMKRIVVSFAAATRSDTKFLNKQLAKYGDVPSSLRDHGSSLCTEIARDHK